MTNHEGEFFRNEYGDYCTFLELNNSYYEITVCLEHGPPQNIYRQFNENTIDKLVFEGKFERIQKETSKQKIRDFMEEKKSNGKYSLFWKELDKFVF